MKTGAITVVLILAGFISAISQIEYDDVYFSGKDRKREVSQTPKTMKSPDQAITVNQSHTKAKPVLASGYTGRTINPDHQPGTVSTVSSSYFTPNYQPMGVNNQLNKNPMYPSNNYYPYNSYGNNFGGGYYSPYNAWGYPSYGYGGFNSGYGWNSCNYGMNSYYSGWGNPYYGYGMGYGYGSFYGSWSGYGSSYGSYYPTTVVVINSTDTHINRVYGKRLSRSTDYSNNATSYTTSSRGTNVSTTSGSQGGRVATSGTSASNTYYQRGWRQNPSINPTATNTNSGRASSYNNSRGTSGGGRSTWGTSGDGWSGSGNSTWNNGSFGGGSRGGSFNSGGSVGGGSSGGRSGGGSGGHSSGGTRGRN